MEYFKKALAYLFKYDRGKRFFVFAAILIVPCGIIAFFFPFSNLISFFFDYFKLSFSNWGHLWLGLTQHTWFSLIGLGVSFVLLVLGTSFVTAVINRHIRTGNFGVPKFIYSVNENFFPAVALTFYFCCIILITYTLYTLFLFLWMQLASQVFAFILSILVFLLFFGAVGGAMSAATLWLPTMSHNGLSMFRAYNTAVYKARGLQRKFFVSILVLMTFMLLLGLCGHFARSIWFVKWIVNTVNYVICAVFYITFCIISYCEVESITREDLAKLYFRR